LFSAGSASASSTRSCRCANTLLVAANRLRSGHPLDPQVPPAVVDRSSLQLVAGPSLAIGEHVHPEDGPVLILIEYRVDEGRCRRLLGLHGRAAHRERRPRGTRWGVYQDVTAHGKFSRPSSCLLARLPAPARSLHHGGQGGRGASLRVPPGTRPTEDHPFGPPRHRRGARARSAGGGGCSGC